MKKIIFPVALLVIACIAALLMYLNSSQPALYTNVVVGPEADVQVNFISFGRKIYIDENKDGVADAEELAGSTKLDEAISLKSKDGSRTYKLMGRLMFGDDTVSETFPQKFELNLDVTSPSPADEGRNLVFTQVGYIVMGKEVEKASVIRFDGPLENNVVGFNINELARGRDFDLSVEIAVQQTDDTGWVALCVGRHLFNEQTHPIAQLEYRKTADAELTVETYPIDEFC